MIQHKGGKTPESRCDVRAGGRFARDVASSGLASGLASALGR